MPLNWLVITDQRTPSIRTQCVRIFVLCTDDPVDRIKEVFGDFDFSFIRFRRWKKCIFFLRHLERGWWWYTTERIYPTEYTKQMKENESIQSFSQSVAGFISCSKRTFPSTEHIAIYIFVKGDFPLEKNFSLDRICFVRLSHSDRRFLLLVLCRPWILFRLT